MTAAMALKVKGADAVEDVSSHASEAERRRAPRILVDLEVDYASEENYLFAYITENNATGIFGRTTSPEGPGTRLNLRFKPDDASAPIEVEGEVIWVNPFRPGAPD